MKRPWRTVQGEGQARNDSGVPQGGSTVTLVQWNILSQTLGVEGDFCVCPEKALEWEHRKRLLAQELLSYKADLLCLEEVDCFQELSSVLQPAGFAGIWVPKLDSPCLKYQNNMGPDGNALFYSKEKFSLISSYHQILTLQNGENSNSTVLVVELEHLESRKKVTLLVTHLKAKETRENQEIRRQQTLHILKILSTLRTDKVILAGDFNSSLDEPVYEMVRETGMESAYQHVMTREPEYTTWKIRGQRGSSPLGEKKRTIDFVFYRGPGLTPQHVLDVPGQADLGANRLPNLEFPSDHMSLVVKFDLV